MQTFRGRQIFGMPKILETASPAVGERPVPRTAGGPVRGWNDPANDGKWVALQRPMYLSGAKQSPSCWLALGTRSQQVRRAASRNRSSDLGRREPGKAAGEQLAEGHAALQGKPRDGTVTGRALLQLPYDGDPGGIKLGSSECDAGNRIGVPSGPARRPVKTSSLGNSVNRSVRVIVRSFSGTWAGTLSFTDVLRGGRWSRSQPSLSLSLTAPWEQERNPVHLRVCSRTRPEDGTKPHCPEQLPADR